MSLKKEIENIIAFFNKVGIAFLKFGKVVEKR